MKHRLVKKRQFLALNLTIMVLLGATAGMELAMAAESGAVDTKYFAGSICRDYRSITKEAITYTPEGFATNAQSDKELNLVCPLLRDNSTTSKGIGAIGIYVTDNHPFEDISCYVVSRRLNGELVDSSPRIESQGTGTKTLWQSSSVITRASDSYLFLQCKIPPKSRGKVSMIKSFVITENP